MLIFLVVFVLMMESYVLHVLIYAFVAVMLELSLFKSYPRPFERVCGTLLYAMLMVIQIVYSITCAWTPMNRFIAVILLIPSFLVEYYILKGRGRLDVTQLLDDTCLSFEDLRHLSRKIRGGATAVCRAGKAMNREVLGGIIGDLPRNSSIRYLAKGSLSDEYMVNIEKSLEDPYVYLVLTDSGSPTSDFIRVFTQKAYNHASISFDRELVTLVSFNGGERITPPGMNQEMLWWFYKKEDANIRIYRLKVTTDQKAKMIARIKQIDREGSAYNIMGLALKKSFRPNIMFCSHFVYSLLESVDAQYFQKEPIDVRPTDFVELDYDRKLEFVERIYLSKELETAQAE